MVNKQDVKGQEKGERKIAGEEDISDARGGC